MSLFQRSQKIGPLPPTANPYPSRFQQFRTRLNRFGAMGFVIFLLITSAFFPGFRQGLQETTLDSISWIVNTVQTPFRLMENYYHDAQSLAELKTHVKELEAERDHLKKDLLFTRQLEVENKSLRDYLNVPHEHPIQFVTSSILSLPQKNLRHTVLLGAGSKTGVEKGQAVISSEGVIGRIKETGQNSSRATLLTDTHSRIPVYLPRTQQRAILAGNGSSHPSLVYLVDVQDIQEGDIILTSGLGGVFPKGVPVGSVKKIQGGLAKVHLASSPLRFHYLQILMMPTHEESSKESSDVG